MKFKILIVDDEPDLLELMAEEFSSFGCHALLAASGMEAITILKREKVHLVVSDSRMPNGSGTDLLSFINLMEERPCFFFFSSEVELSGNNFKRLGAQESFSKPQGFLRLLSEVKQQFAHFKKGKHDFF